MPELIDGDYAPPPPPEEIGGVSVTQAIQIATNYGLPPPSSSGPPAAGPSTQPQAPPPSPSAHHPRQLKRAAVHRLSGWREPHERPAPSRPAAPAHPTAALTMLAYRHASQPARALASARRGAGVWPPPGSILRYVRSPRFIGGAYEVVRTNRPLTVYRFFGGKAPKKGDLFTYARATIKGQAILALGDAFPRDLSREAPWYRATVTIRSGTVIDFGLPWPK